MCFALRVLLASLLRPYPPATLPPHLLILPPSFLPLHSTPFPKDTQTELQMGNNTATNGDVRERGGACNDKVISTGTVKGGGGDGGGDGKESEERAPPEAATLGAIIMDPSRPVRLDALKSILTFLTPGEVQAFLDAAIGPDEQPFFEGLRQEGTRHLVCMGALYVPGC